MSLRTFLIFIQTILTMAILSASGALVFHDDVASPELVGSMIFAGMLSAVLLGAMAIGFGAGLELSQKQER